VALPDGDNLLRLLQHLTRSQAAARVAGRVVVAPRRGGFVAEHGNYQGKNERTDSPLSGCPTRRKVFLRPQNDQTHPQLELRHGDRAAQ
jgi:hypothetical protein